MQVVKYDPFRDMRKIERDIDKLWGLGLGLPAIADTSAMDMYEEAGNLIAEVNLPNFKKDEVKVTADQGVLEVSAQHKEKEENKGKRRYYFRESSNQYFRRAALPEGARADKAGASFKDGVLKVTIPMTTQKKAKAIAVK